MISSSIISIIITSLVLFVTLAESQCPEDPLDCLIRDELKRMAEAAKDDSMKQQSTTTGSTTTAVKVNREENGKTTTHRSLIEEVMGPTEEEIAEDAIRLASDGRFSLNDTLESGCGENQTHFMSPENKTILCRKCSVCPKNGLLLRQCDSRQDTQCVCEKGTYLSVVDYECKSCSPCPDGYGVWRQCFRNRNTVCRKCPPGTYSGVLSGTLGCILCSSCRSDQLMLQECTRHQDTICVDKPVQSGFMKPTSVPSVTDNGLGHLNAEHHNSYDTNDNNNRIHLMTIHLPIYFSLLIIIIFGLTFYVAFKCYGEQQRKTKNKLTMVQNKLHHLNSHQKNSISGHHNQNSGSNGHKSTSSAPLMMMMMSNSPNHHLVTSSPYHLVTSSNQHNNHHHTPSSSTNSTAHNLLLLNPHSHNGYSNRHSCPHHKNIVISKPSSTNSSSRLSPVGQQASSSSNAISYNHPDEHHHQLPYPKILYSLTPAKGLSPSSSSSSDSCRESSVVVSNNTRMILTYVPASYPTSADDNHHEDVRHDESDVEEQHDEDCADTVLNFEDDFLSTESS